MNDQQAAMLNERLARRPVPVTEKVLAAIVDFLRRSGPEQLAGINPLRFARRHKLKRVETLKAFLHLTRAGLFDLTWATHCPHCKGVSSSAAGLEGLSTAGHCPLCERDFESTFDGTVEAQFQLSPDLAPGTAPEPFRAILAALDLEPGLSFTLEPGEEHYLEFAALAGNYLLILEGERRAINFPVSAEADLSSYRLVVSGDGSPILSRPLRGGPAQLRVVNGFDHSVEVAFHRLVAPDWTNAALVSSLQEFRDLFSREILSQNEAFSIRNLAFLFTDIKASTEMYENLGDTRAYFLVKEHFRILEEVVREGNGGIVKTIGDAIMAVFVSPADALTAALAMVRRFDTFNLAQNLDHQIIIKVGLHAGPCIAVTLNEKLDYFGTTVNVAARVQGLSDGRSIVVSESLFDDAGGSDLVRVAEASESAWKAERFTTSLKGLKAHYAVYKIHLEPGATP